MEAVGTCGILLETYTGVVEEELESLIQEQPQNPLEDFTLFDPNDAIFQEFDPPQGHEADPKAWKLSLPTFKKCLLDCFKSVLLIHTVAGTLIGFVAVFIVFLDFSTLEWCYDENSRWNQMPISVQRLRVTAQTVEGFFIELWDLITIITVFPLSLIKDLHLLTLNLLASFIDVTYRLYFQMYGIYRISWMSYPLNVLFSLTIIINHYLLARHFCPHSLKKTIKIDFILSAQFLLGIPVAFFMVYVLFPFYVRQTEDIKVLIAAVSPLVTFIPKVVSRLGAQTLRGVIHPGTAYVLVTVIYGASAVVFRVMQAEITSIELFIALGIAHAITDLLERIAITMKDHILKYCFIRRRRGRPPKYRTLRSRRFMADVSIQIMMQEATVFIIALGYINVYQLLYSRPKPFANYQLILGDFATRAIIGLLIDLVFNTISLLIQTRVMNVAVNRVWRKKWRHHTKVNILLVCVSVLYFSGHLFELVRSKHEKGDGLHYHSNCSFPGFL